MLFNKKEIASLLVLFVGLAASDAFAGVASSRSTLAFDKDEQNKIMEGVKALKGASAYIEAQKRESARMANEDPATVNLPEARSGLRSLGFHTFFLVQTHSMPEIASMKKFILGWTHLHMMTGDAEKESGVVGLIIAASHLDPYLTPEEKAWLASWMKQAVSMQVVRLITNKAVETKTFHLELETTVGAELGDKALLEQAKKDFQELASGPGSLVQKILEDKSFTIEKRVYFLHYLLNAAAILDRAGVLPGSESFGPGSPLRKAVDLVANTNPKKALYALQVAVYFNKSYEAIARKHVDLGDIKTPVALGFIVEKAISH